MFGLQDSDNPDLRDRGYIYWRLLSTDPAAAKVRVFNTHYCNLECTMTLPMVTLLTNRAASICLYS
jgi:hypothetical protein